MGKFRLVDALFQLKAIIFVQVQSIIFKVKEHVYVRETGIHLHSAAIMIYPCSCFHFTVKEISRNKTKNCTRRLTAVEIKKLLQS